MRELNATADRTRSMSAGAGKSYSSGILQAAGRVDFAMIFGISQVQIRGLDPREGHLQRGPCGSHVGWRSNLEVVGAIDCCRFRFEHAAQCISRRAKTLLAGILCCWGLGAPVPVRWARLERAEWSCLGGAGVAGRRRVEGCSRWKERGQSSLVRGVWGWGASLT